MTVVRCKFQRSGVFSCSQSSLPCPLCNVSIQAIFSWRLDGFGKRDALSFRKSQLTMIQTSQQSLRRPEPPCLLGPGGARTSRTFTRPMALALCFPKVTRTEPYSTSKREYDMLNTLTWRCKGHNGITIAPLGTALTQRRSSQMSMKSCFSGCGVISAPRAIVWKSHHTHDLVKQS